MQQISKQHGFWEMKMQTSHQNKESKVVITRYPLLNGISEKGLSKSHIITVGNFPCGMSSTIVENHE